MSVNETISTDIKHRDAQRHTVWLQGYNKDTYDHICTCKIFP